MDTIGFYDRDPEGYSGKTFTSDMSESRDRFASMLPEGASVLDLGCGSGRDSLAFSGMGFRVTPVDGSEGMCQVAEANTGMKARRLLFSELDYKNEFDGVWACCSLLHVPSSELPGILGLVRRSLRANGVFFCCFKEGGFEGEREGRYYLDLVGPELRRYLTEAGFEVSDIWYSLEPGRELRWVNAVSRVTP